MSISPDLFRGRFQFGYKGEGFVLLFLQSTTSVLTIMEYEDGLLADIPKTMERLIPRSNDYEHEKANYDGNGHSHVRSSLVGVDLTVPF